MDPLCLAGPEFSVNFSDGIRFESATEQGIDRLATRRDPLDFLSHLQMLRPSLEREALPNSRSHSIISVQNGTDCRNGNRCQVSHLLLVDGFQNLVEFCLRDTLDLEKIFL